MKVVSRICRLSDLNFGVPDHCIIKALIYLFALIPHLTFGQCDPAGNGTLSAEVQNNSVILRNDTIHCNCGALYTMGISWLSDDSLIWMQTDTGEVAFCYCHFDLSVTSIPSLRETILQRFIIPT